MAIDSGRLKHLELIQQVITRMANNSFLLKGWSVTLLSAILAIAASKDGQHKMVWIGFVPMLTFWLLDGFFLRQERLFRKLWDKKRKENQDTATDFDMSTEAVSTEVDPWLKVCFSPTLRIFYGALTLILILALIIIYRS
jgi:hypothetical protein